MGIIKLLLENGADPYVKSTEYGVDAFETAQYQLSGQPTPTERDVQIQRILTMLWEAVSPTSWRVLHGTDAFAGQNAEVDYKASVKICKEKCLDKNFGAFVLWKGNAYYRHQPADACFEERCDGRGATLYLAPEFSQTALVCFAKTKHEAWAAFVRSEGLSAAGLDPNMHSLTTLRSFMASGCAKQEEQDDDEDEDEDEDEDGVQHKEMETLPLGRTPSEESVGALSDSAWTWMEAGGTEIMPRKASATEMNAFTDAWARAEPEPQPQPQPEPLVSADGALVRQASAGHREARERANVQVEQELVRQTEMEEEHAAILAHIQAMTEGPPTPRG